MWTGQPFDFHGRRFRLTGAICRPTPIQRPGPPIMIGGWGSQTLRVVAEHADVWNVPGPPHLTIDEIVGCLGVLDEHCVAIGRDPGDITRSSQIIVSYDDATSTRAIIRELIDAGSPTLCWVCPHPIRRVSCAGLWTN
jgi:alkanesulfonate monooxygenase SsuD/methylene tetrahydromethanopterin reductase-like flavin-dependent oxidoreductase (luciferase family)